MKINFTQHAKKRLRIRKLYEEEIIDAIKNPDRIIKKHGKYYYQKRLNRGRIEVSTEKRETHINVITLYWI